MADSRLIDYIRTRVAQGARRMELSVELVRVGWPPTQINEALNELNVPMDDTPVPVPASEALPVQAPSLQSAAPALETLEMPESISPSASPLSQSPTQVAQSLQRSNSEPEPESGTPLVGIPGLLTLLSGALRRYQERLPVFIGIAVALLILEVALYGEMFLLPWMKQNLGSILMLLLTLLFSFVVFGFFIWSYIALYVTAMQRESVANWRVAFKNASRIAGSLVWVQILSEFVVVGAVVLFVVVPAAAFFGALALTGVLQALPSSVSLILLVLSLLVAFGVGFYYFARVTFGTWRVVNSDTRGIGALVQSAHLVQGSVWAIILGLLGILISGVILYIPVWLIAWGMSTAGSYAGVFSGFLISAYEFAFLMPFGILAITMLYESLPEEAPTEKLGRRWYVFLAWFGLVAVFLVPVIGGTVVISLKSARHIGSDAALTSDLMAIQIEAELYNYEHNDSYGLAQSCSEGMFAEDPTIARALASMTQDNGSATVCSAADGSYMVYSPLSTGEIYCVDSSLYGATTSPTNITRMQCAASEATSSPATQGTAHPASMQVAGFQSGAQTSSVYTNKTNGYSLTFPSGWGWADVPYADGTKGIMAHPDSVITVEVTTDVKPANGMTLAALKTKEIDSIKSISTSTPDTQDRTVGGLPAVQISSYVVDSGGQGWKALQLIVLKEGKFYLLSGEAPANEWQTYKPTIMKILQSITFSS